MRIDPMLGGLWTGVLRSTSRHGPARVRAACTSRARVALAQGLVPDRAFRDEARGRGPHGPGCAVSAPAARATRAPSSRMRKGHNWPSSPGSRRNSTGPQPAPFKSASSTHGRPRTTSKRRQRRSRPWAAYHADLGWAGTRAFGCLGVRSLDPLQTPFLLEDYSVLDAVCRDDVTAEMLEPLTRLGLIGLVVLPGAQRKPFAFTRRLLGPRDYEGQSCGSTSRSSPRRPIAC